MLVPILLFSNDHLEGLPDRLKEEAYVLPKLVPCDCPYAMSEIHDVIKQIFVFYLNRATNSKKAEFNKFVKHELQRGGGNLFKYIAAADKKFLNVHWGTHSKDAAAKNCAEFLSEQAEIWGKYWNPKSDLYTGQELAIEMRFLWNAAVENHSNIVFGETQLDEALKGYKKRL